MPTLPQLNVKKNCNYSPHVMILGAGASLAAFPDGDKNGLKLPLMHNLVDVLNLKPLIQDYGLNYQNENFEKFYDDLVNTHKHQDLVLKINDEVENYFNSMLLPQEATLYDYLILSMRGKDLIATFNWDPFLAQAYQRNIEAVGSDNMPQIAFLHGNVAIGICTNCKVKGWRYNSCDKCSEQFSPSKLLYPISKKDYSSDPFLESEWKTLQHFIKQAYFITFFGYSAPVTDVEARKLMLEVWLENPTRELAEIELIDIKPKSEVKNNWKDFIDNRHFGIYKNFHDTYLSYHPRRTCDALAMATLQLRPWKENPFPKNKSLKQIQDWVRPLIDEENKDKFSGKPCDLI